jgi:hypothetical protein
MQRGKRPTSAPRLAVALVLSLVASPLLGGCSSGSATSPAASASSSAPSSTTSATPSGTPSWAPVSPSATGPRQGVTLDLTGRTVGPVAIGDDGRAVETALVELLGVPDRTTDGPGCTLFTPVPRERALFWGDFHVLMTAPATTDPAVTLTGWSVDGHATPVPARLPHGVEIGRSTGTDVTKADPKAESGMSLGAGIVLRDTAGVDYVLSGETPASPVVQVSVGIAACE